MECLVSVGLIGFNLIGLPLATAGDMRVTITNCLCELVVLDNILYV